MVMGASGVLRSGVNWGQVNMCSTEKGSSLLHEGHQRGKGGISDVCE